MQSLTLESPTQTVSRGRVAAWQVAWAVPLVVFAASTLLQLEPTAQWQTSCGIVLLLLVAAAAFTDLRWCKIPNWLTYPAFTWAILANAISHAVSPEFTRAWGVVGIVDSLAGAIIPFFFMLVIFSMTGGGAGDVKLTAALGAFLGLARVIDVLLLSIVFAGGFAAIRVIWTLGPQGVASLIYRRVGSWLLPLSVAPPTQEQRDFMRQPMPLGPSFAIGTALVLFDLRMEWILGYFGI